eukprot:4243428-Pyramimonas_sp.AAC.1
MPVSRAATRAARTPWGRSPMTSRTSASATAAAPSSSVLRGAQCSKRPRLAPRRRAWGSGRTDPPGGRRRGGG